MLELNIVLTVTCEENILSKLEFPKKSSLKYEFRILIDVI